MIQLVTPPGESEGNTLLPVPSDDQLIDEMVTRGILTEAERDELPGLDSKGREYLLSEKAMYYLYTEHHPDLSSTILANGLIQVSRPVAWRSLMTAALFDGAVGKDGSMKGKSNPDGPFAGFISGEGLQGVGKFGSSDDPEKIKGGNYLLKKQYNNSKENLQKVLDIVDNAKDRDLTSQEIEKSNYLLEHYNMDVPAATKDGKKVFVFLDEQGRAMKDGKKVIYAALNDEGKYVRVNDDHSLGNEEIQIQNGFKVKPMNLISTTYMKVNEKGEILDASSDEKIQYEKDGSIKLPSNVKLAGGDIDQLGNAVVSYTPFEKTKEQENILLYQKVVDEEVQKYANSLESGEDLMVIYEKYRKGEEDTLILSPQEKMFIAKVREIEWQHDHVKKLLSGTDKDLALSRALIEDSKGTGSIQHGPESANILFPQKFDDHLFVAMDHPKRTGIIIKTIRGGEQGYVDFMNEQMQEKKKEGKHMDTSIAVNSAWGWQKNQKEQFEISKKRINIGGPVISQDDEKLKATQINIMNKAINYNKAIFYGASPKTKHQLLQEFVKAELKYKENHGKYSPVMDLNKKSNYVKNVVRYALVKEKVKKKASVIGKKMGDAFRQAKRRASAPGRTQQQQPNTTRDRGRTI